jgi:hypothetical protein
MPGLMNAPFSPVEGGVLVALPAPLIGLLNTVAAQENDDHPLAAGPLAVVPGSATDPLAALEAEMVADRMVAARGEALTEQRRLISRLDAARIHAGVAADDVDDLVCLTLDTEDAFTLLAWLNRQWVAMRTDEVGTISVGAEQSAAVFLGLDDPSEQDTADVPFGMLAGLFAALASELVAAID